MKKEIISSERLGEQYTVIRHPSGCTVCLYPTREKTAVALFSTRYGSVDTTFKTAADSDYVTVPEGIAHYLEHKLFESDECSVFDLFAETGAQVNAYTSFDATTYLFLSTKDFAKNLRLLLDFVQRPYFTDENVEKERGIIEQEIKMYLDDPGTRVFITVWTRSIIITPSGLTSRGRSKAFKKSTRSFSTAATIPFTI